MIIYSPNPTFVPSLSKIGDLSCITSCLVLPGFLMDTLLNNFIREFTLENISFCRSRFSQNSTPLIHVRTCHRNIATRSEMKVQEAGGTSPPLVETQCLSRRSQVLFFRFLYQAKFCDWSFIFPMLGTHSNSSN